MPGQSFFKQRRVVVLGACVILASLSIAYMKTSDDPAIAQTVCSIEHAGPEMVSCMFDETCRNLLTCMATCEDPTSSRRIEAVEKNKHLQHPDSPIPCTVSCMDDYDSELIDDLLTAIMSRNCAADSKLVDTCFDVGAVRPFSDDPKEFDMKWLEGEWESIATGGWDHWDCQKKIFHSPEESGKGREWYSTFWATYRTYPKSRDGKPKDNYVFEEIYPNDKEENGPTWRTRFDLWGTESREEWHVFAFDKGNEATGEAAWAVAEVCIATPSIKHMDVFTIVLAKTKEPSPAMKARIDSVVKEKMGYPLVYVNNSVCAEDPQYERKR